MSAATLAGLDFLATAIMLVDRELTVRYANAAAENLFELSTRALVGHTLANIFGDDRVLGSAIDYARANNCSYTEHDLELGAAGHNKLHLSCTISPVETESGIEGRSANESLLEFRHIEQQLKISREERLLDQGQANRELIRNLAHEIKNPL
ncbi:MAG: PAS domain-containing protein, partial [Pseudomonadota bacterium]